MQIHVVGSPEKWPGKPGLLDGETVKFVELPCRIHTPLSFFKFLRALKKCTIIYWIEDDSTRFSLPFLPGWVVNWVSLRVLKLPKGPSVVVQPTAGNSRLGRFADIVAGGDHKDTFKKAYFLVECGHPKSIYDERTQCDRIQWLKNRSKGKLLEIGCATGHVLDFVGGGTGVDVDDLRLEYAKLRYPSHTFIKADATRLPFGDHEFDTVLIPDILEHVPIETARRIVVEARRVGRQIVITVPNAEKPDYDKALVENPEHLWFPTREIMRELTGPNAVISSSTWDDFLYVELSA